MVCSQGFAPLSSRQQSSSYALFEAVTAVNTLRVAVAFGLLARDGGSRMGPVHALAALSRCAQKKAVSHVGILAAATILAATTGRTSVAVWAAESRLRLSSSWL